MLYRILVTVCLLSIVLIGQTCAQAVFPEGVLVYRIDTVRRLETQPAMYKNTQFKLYKKGELLRVERVSVSVFDPTDMRSIIEIRNKEGIYTLMDSPARPIDFAMFSTYEEDALMRSQAALQGRLETYTVKNVGQKAVVLSMPTEKLVVTSSDKSDPIEVRVSKAIDAPVALFFEPFKRIDGTPLQFTESQLGWLCRYTIESVTAKSLPDDLFKIDPKLKTMTMEQMLKELRDFK